MSAFGLKRTQIGITMALLVLCVSICPHSGYPHAEEDEDPTAEKEHLDSEEDQELFLGEEEALEEEEADLEEDTNVENDSTYTPCANAYETCLNPEKTNSGLPCCSGLGLECKDLKANLGWKCVKYAT